MLVCTLGNMCAYVSVTSLLSCPSLSAIATAE